MSGYCVCSNCGCNTSHDCDCDCSECIEDAKFEAAIEKGREAFYEQETREERDSRLEYENKSNSVRTIALILLLCFPFAIMACAAMKSFITFIICTIFFLFIIPICINYSNYYDNLSREKLNNFLREYDI